MKLDKNLKEIIDQYFAEISAEELFHILTNKYNFKEDNNTFISKGEYEIIDNSFSNVFKCFFSYEKNHTITQEIETKDLKSLECDHIINKTETYCDEMFTPLAA